MDAYSILGTAFAAALAPLFWLVIAGVTLWIGRNVCNDKWGRRLFGHYWNPRQQEALGEQSTESPRGRISQLCYRLGQKTGRRMGRQ